MTAISMPRDEIEGRGGKAFAATQLKKKDRIVPIARRDGVSMLRLSDIRVLSEWHLSTLGCCSQCNSFPLDNKRCRFGARLMFFYYDLAPKQVPAYIWKHNRGRHSPQIGCCARPML